MTIALVLIGGLVFGFYLGHWGPLRRDPGSAANRNAKPGVIQSMIELLQKDALDAINNSIPIEVPILVRFLIDDFDASLDGTEKKQAVERAMALMALMGRFPPSTPSQEALLALIQMALQSRVAELRTTYGVDVTVGPTKSHIPGERWA